MLLNETTEEEKSKLEKKTLAKLLELSELVLALDSEEGLSPAGLGGLQDLFRRAKEVRDN